MSTCTPSAARRRCASSTTRRNPPSSRKGSLYPATVMPTPCQSTRLTLPLIHTVNQVAYLELIMFPAHTIDSAPGAHEAMLGVQRKFGGIPPVVARLANAPHLLNTFLVSSAAVEASSLPPIAREVVIMMVAVRNDCEVCIGIHSSVLRRLGREDLADALMAGRELNRSEERRVGTECRRRV